MTWKIRTSAGLLVGLALALACGQQTAPPSPQTSATQKKGQIVQPEVKPGKAADASGLVIDFRGCADLVLADALGRKLGYDPASDKSYQQIPRGVYDEGDLINDDEAEPEKPDAKPASSKDCASSAKAMQVAQPLAGSYKLKIINSTGNPFKVEITSYGTDGANGHFVLSQPAGATVVFVYQFQLPPSSSGLEVRPVPTAVPGPKH